MHAFVYTHTRVNYVFMLFCSYMSYKMCWPRERDQTNAAVFFSSFFLFRSLEISVDLLNAESSGM